MSNMPKKQKLSCPIVIVEWEDACNYVNKTLEEVYKDNPLIVRTFGVLFMTKEHCIVMTHHGINADNDFMRIPKCLVRKIIKLKPQNVIFKYKRPSK